MLTLGRRETGGRKTRWADVFAPKRSAPRKCQFPSHQLPACMFHCGLLSSRAKRPRPNSSIFRWFRHVRSLAWWLHRRLPETEHMTTADPVALVAWAAECAIAPIRVVRTCTCLRFSTAFFALMQIRGRVQRRHGNWPSILPDGYLIFGYHARMTRITLGGHW
jgi:hypothetical protein